jgi:DegV family protein with EDD domain
MTVAVVTDSTAYLPDSALRRWHVRVAPVLVTIAGKTYHEDVDVSPATVARALRDWQPVTTSRPSPAEFADIYRNALADGAQAIVSIHLSGDLSGTYESALLAARDSEVPVQVLDSRSIGMGLGFPVLAAARTAAQSASLEEVVAVARKEIDTTQLLFYVDTLEYLRRGGRIGKASAMVGTALRVKPLLQVVDGRVEPLEKARTAGKALARLADIAVERAAGRRVEAAVQHLDSPGRADQLAEELRKRLNLDEVMISEVGAVVGTHVGPGMVCVALAEQL